MDPFLLFLFLLVQLLLFFCVFDSFRRLKKEFTEYLSEHRQRVERLNQRYEELVKKCIIDLNKGGKGEW